MIKKAFIFDLDGTIVDSLANITHCVNRTTASFGLSSIPIMKIRAFVGNGSKFLITRSLEDLGAEEQFEEIFAAFSAFYEANSNYALKTYEGICETLAALKARGVKLAVLSNKPHGATLPICEQLFGDLLDYVHGQKEGIPVKPDPTGLVSVLQALDVTADECVYIGDSEVDMQTGKNGGMYTVGVPWGFRDEDVLWQNGADTVIHHPEDLLKLI